MVLRPAAQSLEVQEKQPAVVEIYACRYDASWVFVRQHELCAADKQRLIVRDKRRGLKVIDKRPDPI